MSDKQIQILEAASECFMRYGLRRTTMSEVASAAKVSRPTLYGFYSNKEEMLGGVIRHYNETLVATMKAEMGACASLSAKLDIYFDHAVLRLVREVRDGDW